MPYIQLRDAASGDVQDFHTSVVRVGRDPEFEIVPTGAIADVVSGRHLMLVHDEGRWWIEDLGSSNGTYLNDELLKPGKRQPIVRGAVVRLGKAGPEFSVVQTAERRASPTLIEDPGVLPALEATTPIVPTPAPEVPEVLPVPEPLVVFRDSETGEQYVARGDRVLIGRSQECDVQLTRDHDTSVSRNHAELLVHDGRALLRDLRSRNGTYVNGSKLAGDCEIAVGDCLQLGPSGPELVVHSMTMGGYAAGTGGDPSASLHGIESSAALGSGWARRRNVVGTDGAEPRSRNLRKVFLSGIVLVVLFAGGIVGFTNLRTRWPGVFSPATNADPAAHEDGAVEEADSSETRVRTESEVDGQMAFVDSIRQVLDGEVARLQSDVQRATELPASQEVLDSLRTAAKQVEQRAAAMAGVDFAALAEGNQAGVGLVSAYGDGQVVTAVGFMLTPSGFFMTVGRVVMHTGRRADSVFVTMVNRRQRVPADVVRISNVPNVDLALLRISEYAGPTVSGVDWDREAIHSGDVGVILGIPPEHVTVADSSAALRVVMHAVIFGDASTDRIQFDNFGVGGSSGSPIFNRRGQVVAVYGASPLDAAGLAGIAPVWLAEDLLPVEARRALRLPSGE